MSFGLCGLFLLAAMSIRASVPGDSIQSDQASRRWYVPNYIPVQYAGNIGFLSTGVGFTFPGDRFQASLQYGYVPRQISVIPVHTITARGNFHLYNIKIDNDHSLIPYLSLGFSLEVAGRSFFFLPDNMPAKYYRFPKSIHAIPALGAKLRYSGGKGSGLLGYEFFVEATTVDAYIWYKFISNDVRVGDIVTLAVGVNLMVF